MINTKFELEGIEEFTKTAFQKKPFVFSTVHGAKLLNWDDVNLLLEKDILDYPRVRLANDSNPAILQSAATGDL